VVINNIFSFRDGDIKEGYKIMIIRDIEDDIRIRKIEMRVRIINIFDENIEDIQRILVIKNNIIIHI
jgi:hypothetical protein